MTTSGRTPSAPWPGETGTAPPSDPYLLGADPLRTIDLLLVNAPIRDYTVRPRTNNFTLPVLGMGYIATYAAANGFNVGLLDGEALGLTVEQIQQTVNQAAPRWAGFNLLAPTYELSAMIAAGLDPNIELMVGGHQAKAMPHTIVNDRRFHRLSALIIGEGESRVVELLADRHNRRRLPGVMWRDPLLRTPVTGGMPGSGFHLAPDINTLPFVDRRLPVPDG